MAEELLETQSTPVSILVAEDDTALRALFIALLKRHGLDVECVPDGAQALERLARRTYDVILLDLMMPVTNGYDVLQYFAEAAPSLLRQTIVTTGVSERELAKIDASRVYAVLRKPFDIDRLVTTVLACALENTRRGPRGKSRPGRVRGEVQATLERSARRLEAVLPKLRAMLSSAVVCERELLVRHQLRQVIGRLAGVLSDAASMQSDAARAERYRQLGRSASRLAARPVTVGN